MAYLTEFTYSDTYPQYDGHYLCRMDDCDDEPMTIEVKDGKAYQKNGGRRFIHGFEWKAIITMEEGR